MTAVLGKIAAAAAIILAAPAPAPAPASAARLVIPRNADQLIVVSSPTAHPPPPQDLATLRAYTRSRPGSPWRLAHGPWPAETGSGHMVAAAERREGDHATPTGVFTFGATIYGNDRDPGGLHYRYHRLVCGDWWDEDPYSATYNRFVRVRCGVTPSFAPGSEPLWTETRAYPYFALIDFNVGPIRAGVRAPGSGIFLHSWLDAPTEGCVALPESRLLQVLRWLRPAQHPVIEIGTTAELAVLNVD
ncbi:MAG TPA: L,D-transpeptidase family protein [Solirubrobacteraceae bacterium]|nr:L,D-transpeptidase family protein [Solirubrobacteraceae bacterium]